MSNITGLNSDQESKIKQEVKHEAKQENIQESKQESEQTVKDVINDYVNKRNVAKQNMINKFSKHDMVNIIFKQNDLLAQQSSQMLEIVEMANTIEKNVRTDEVNKCSNIKRANNVCTKISNVRKQQLNLYENSVRVQIVLFVLLLIVLVWFLFHYTYSSDNTVTSSTS